MALTRPKVTQFDTVITSISDPITVLKAGGTSANVDIGFVMNRANGLVANVALYWSESENSFVTAFTSNSGITNTNVTPGSYTTVTTGNLVPGSNVAYSLGTTTKRWKDLWLSGSTIYLGGATLSAPSSGIVTITNDTGGSFSVTGSAPGQASGTFGNLVANSGVASTSTTTGALQVAGGAGITGELYVGGNLIVSGSTNTINNTIYETTEYVVTQYANSVYAATLGNIGANVVGTGTYLTSLNATNLASGTVPLARLSGITTSQLSGSAGITNGQLANNSVTVTAGSNLTDGGTVALGGSVTLNLSPTVNLTTLNAATIGNIGANVVGTGTYLTSLSGANLNSSSVPISALVKNSVTITTSTGLSGGDTVTLGGTLILTNTGVLSITPGTGITANAATGSLLITNTGVTNLSSSGAGNLVVSAATGIVTLGLPTTGPGATNVGSSTSIPTIVTDPYGRIVSLTSNAVSTTINTTGTTGTGSVSGGGTLTFTSTNGVAVAASGSTLSVSTAQNLQTTASPTFAGLTTNGATQVNGTLGVTGVTNITNNTVSSGAGNGALVVTGGIGAGSTSYFGQDLYVVGNIYTANLVATTTSTLNTSSPMAYFQVSPSYPYNFETGFYSHFIGGPANVYAHTGIVRNHNNNYWTFFSNVKTEPAPTTINFADAGIIYDTIYAGGLILANTTPSTNTTTGAITVAGGVGITGNLNVNSAGYFGYQASQTQLINPSIIGTASSQSVNAGQYYVQSALINNSGTGSADITAYPNNVVDGSTGFADMGFTGNLFSDPAYTITKANDGYLFASAVAGSGLGGNLVLATDKTGTYNDIVVAVGSFYANSEVARFRGNASTSGYLQITTGTSATSTATGALRVTGGVGITGNVYVDKIYSANGLFWAGNGYAISTGGGSAAGVTGQVQYNNGGTFAGSGLYYYSGNSVILATGGTASTSTSSGQLQVLGGVGVSGAVYAGSLYDNGTRVVSTSSGAGNLTISAGAITLPATGPGATTVGSSTSIPVITTDAYGRISALTSSSVSTTINLSGTSGTGSVSGGGTLTFAGSNGFTATVSGSTITLADPQNLQTSASPTFAGGNFTGNVTRSSRAIVTNYSGNVAPATPVMGDEWFRGNTGVMYKYLYDNVSNTYNWINISAALYNASTSATASTLALRDTGGNLTATNFLGTASSAKYADLAEIYESDKVYQPGTVVVFGGTKEITVTTKTHDTRVAGVISTNPAYLMNSEATGLPVAFTGRVPCLVKGPVTKGDVLVTSAHDRYAERMDDALYRPGCVLGKSLGEVAENEFATIEVVVGRF